MKQILTALAAATEAGAVALLGMLFFAVPTLLFWLTNNNPESTLNALPVVAVSAWLLGHTVPLAFPLSADTAFNIGVVAPSLHIPISLPLLGTLCVTMWFAFRQGRKYAALFITDTSSAAAFGKNAATVVQWRSLAAVVAGAALGFGTVVSIAVTTVVVASPAPSWWQVLKPTLWFTVALLAGMAWVGRRHLAALYRARCFPGDAPLRRTQQVLLAVQIAPRIAAAQLAALVAVAALAVTCAAIFNYVDFVRVSETLHVDVLGLIILFLAQLLLLPVAIIWALAWLSGAGFAVGAETLYSPFATITTELPAVPLFTLLPQHSSGAGVIAPLLLVMLAVVLGYGVAAWMPRHTDAERFYAVTAAAALTGAVIGFAVSVAVGSIGPGRLSYTGADPWVVGLSLAALSAVGLNLGAFLRGAAPQLPHVGETVNMLRDKTKAGLRRASVTTPASQADIVPPGEKPDAAPAPEVTGQLNTAELTEFEPLTASLDTAAAEEKYDTDMLLRNFEWQAKPVQLGKRQPPADDV